MANLSYGQVKSVNKIIGLIGNDIILYSDVQEQLIEFRQNSIDITPETECIVTENFLFKTLLLHQAEVDSIIPDEGQLEAEIQGKMEYYKGLLAQYGQTFETAYGKSELEWKEDIREALIKRNKIDQMQAKITATVTITPREVKAYFESIPLDSIPKINAQVEYAQIVVKPEVNPEAEAYEVERLKRWKKQVESGQEKFGDLAYQWSQDEGTRINKGSFDCVTKGMFVPEFDAMALSLTPGEISEPFKSPFGWHIIQVEERRGKTYCGKHILRVPLVSQGNLDDAKAELDSLKSALVNGDEMAFNLAALKSSDDEQTKFSGGKAINPMTGSTLWDVSQLDRETAVILDQMEVGDISDPFLYKERDRDFFKIIAVTKRVPPHFANLEQDYEMIMTAALNEKKSKIMDEWVENKIAGSYVRIDPEYIGCDFKYNWQKTTAASK